VTDVDVNGFNFACGNNTAAAYFMALDDNDDGRYSNIDANALNWAFNARYDAVVTI
jgi:hypothetical protein